MKRYLLVAYVLAVLYGSVTALVLVVQHPDKDGGELAAMVVQRIVGGAR